MAKGGGRSGGGGGKGKGKGNSFFSGPGTGLGLAGGVYSTQHCTPESTGWYCTLSKVVSTIQMVFFLLLTAFIVYKFSTSFIKRKK